MFTLEQINDIHDRLGNAETLPQYLEALKNIGVDNYDSFITDGHSEYFGKGGHKVVSPPVHEKLTIAKTSNRENFLKHLNLHNEGKTSYLEMSKGLADSGIEKWTFDTNKMTIIIFIVRHVWWYFCSRSRILLHGSLQRPGNSTGIISGLSRVRLHILANRN